MKSGANQQYTHDFSQYKDKLIWFVNIDFLLPVCLLRQRCLPNRIVATVYSQQFRPFNRSPFNLLIDPICRSGLRRLNLVISNHPQLSFDVPSHFIPDYPYRSDIYDSHIRHPKIEQVVCCGIMRDDKDLEGLISAFRSIALPLRIVGRFKDSACAIE